MSKLKKKLLHGGYGLGLLAAPFVALGQETTTAPSVTTTSSDVVTLDEFIIRESAGAAAGDLLPTSRPVMSVFGNQSIVDTPRSVTVLTPELLKQFDIQDFSDLSKIGAGTQQANYYGVPGIPTIRGAKGSVYFNGMQRAYQRNEMPLSFGSIEGMDVVKGPAPGNFGAALVGGYVNLIPKSPYFDAKRGQIQVEVSQHDSIRSQFDVGGPTLLLGKPAAYRISVTGQLADSYYDRVGNDFVSIYGSVKAEISKDVTLFTGGEYFNYKSNENAGWNRPTQQLVDSGRYVIGEPVSVASSAWGGNADRTQIYGNSALVVPASLVNAAVASGKITAAQQAAMNDLSTDAGRTAAYGGALPGAEVAQTTSGFQYTPAYFAAGGTVFTKKIDGSTVLTDDTDFADSQNFFWFGDLESKRNADRTIRLQNIVDYINTEKRSSYGYAFDSEQTVLESKLSISEDIGFLDTALTYGASVRYTDAWQLQDFWDEPFSRRDISLGTISGNSVVFAGGINPANPGTNYWTQFGQGGNVESQLMQLSAFAYGDSKLTERIHVLSSALLGYGSFETGAPAEAGNFPTDEHDKTYTSLSLSPQVKITKELTVYATVQRGTAIDPLQGGPIVGRGSFNKNELEEVGVKGSFLGGKLFSGIAAYHWRQTSFNTRDGGTEELEGKGLEFENTYAVNKNFTLIGSVGYQLVTLEQNAGFRAAGLSEQDWALNAGTLPNNFSGVGVSNGGTPGNNPDREYPGTPQTQAKLFGIYNFDNGFGFSGGGVWSGSYWHNYDHTIKLPSTIVLNASVYFKKPTWDVTLSVENLTNEDYFSGSDPIFGAGTIITKAPETSFKLAYAYRF
jgi:iron complex outermembrane receptor protein